MAGRKTKLTPEIQQVICEAIRLGLTYSAACDLAGIDFTTFTRWVQWGKEQSKGQFYLFYKAVNESNAIAKLALIKRVQAAANEHNVETVKRITGLGEDNKEILIKEERVTSREWDWRAAAWILERRFKNDYGPSLNLGKMSDSELLDFIAGEVAEISGSPTGSEGPGLSTTPGEDSEPPTE